MVGANLRRIREGQGIGLREFARTLSLSHTALSKMERGESKIDADTLPKIATLLNVPCAAFFVASDCPEARRPTAPTVPGSMTAELAVHVARELGIARAEQRRSLELAAQILTIMARHTAPPEGEDTDTA